MEMTKQRKMLIGVLCVGVSALALDRFVLAPPESASASVEVKADDATAAAAPAPRQPVAATATQQADGEARSLPSYARLTEQLAKAQSLQPLQPESDPFDLPADWRQVISEPVEDPKPVTNVEDAIAMAKQRLSTQFTLELAMSEVTPDGAVKYAVVNGKPMRVGEQIQVKAPGDGGHILEEVYKLSAIDVQSRAVIWESVNHAEGRAPLRFMMRVPNR